MFLSCRRQGDQEKRRLFLVPYEVQMRHLIFTPGEVEFSLFKMSLSETCWYSEAPKYHGIPSGDWDPFQP